MRRRTALSAATALLVLACGGGDASPPPPATPVAQEDAFGLPGGWRLVWSDEFDVDGLPDAAKWDYDTFRNSAGWYNNELQYYAANRADNAHVAGGNLVITARRERLSSAPDWGGQNYTSARMVTRGLASWTYGYFEIRAKLPCGRGTWPAIWMLGTRGTWPDDGEIDIMEHSGPNEGVIHGTVHTGQFNGMNGTHRGSTLRVADVCGSFHRYQMRWTADRIVFGVNGTRYFDYVKPAGASYAVWPFDFSQYLLLNVAIGGHLGGTPDNAIFPVQMEVDYVRVYQP